jgi:hypothetical protein
LAGQDVALALVRRLAADAGAFTLSGQDAALRAARRLTADAGAFALAGQDVGLLVLLPSLPPDGRVLTVTAHGRLVLLEALPRKVVVRAAGRIIRIPAVFSRKGEAMSLPIPRFEDDKDPTDVTDWGIDFKQELNLSSPPDSIATAVWILPAGLTAGAQQIIGSEAFTFLSGGAAGTDYVLTCRITTTGGRTFQRSSLVFVRNR